MTRLKECMPAMEEPETVELTKEKQVEELMPAMEEPETVEPTKKEQVKRLMYVEVSGIVVSMIRPLPESDPKAVEIHVFEAIKNSPFVTNLKDGVGIFGKIINELRTGDSSDLDALIARAKQAYYSEKKQEKQL